VSISYRAEHAPPGGFRSADSAASTSRTREVVPTNEEERHHLQRNRRGGAQHGRARGARGAAGARTAATELGTGPDPPDRHPGHTASGHRLPTHPAVDPRRPPVGAGRVRRVGLVLAVQHAVPGDREGVSGRSDPHRGGHELPGIRRDGGVVRQPVVESVRRRHAGDEPKRRPRQTVCGATTRRSESIRAQVSRRRGLAGDRARVLRDRHALLPRHPPGPAVARPGRHHAGQRLVRQERVLPRRVDQAALCGLRIVPPEQRGGELLRTVPEGGPRRRSAGPRAGTSKAAGGDR